MDKLKAMQIFTEVARLNSFSAAADSMNLANSAISRQVNELEEWLGVKLLYRTTRKINLTDEGRAYLERIDDILKGVDDLEQLAKSSQEKVRGNLRITAPVFLGSYLLEPILPALLTRYPDLNVSLILLDRRVNIVEEGFDMALRVAQLEESNLIARQVGLMQLKVVASPKYLKDHSLPQNPSDLKHHNCLYDEIAGHNKRWNFKGTRRIESVPIEGNLTINNGEMIKQMALADIGIAFLPDFFVTDELTNGQLIEILSDYNLDAIPISIIYPYNRQMNLALRTFIDQLIDHIDKHYSIDN